MGIRVDTGSFLAIVVAAALAGNGGGVGRCARRVHPGGGGRAGARRGDRAPGCSIIAHVDKFTEFFSNLGLGMLFFFAGYEIDLARIRGEPLRLGSARVGDVARDRLHHRRRARPGRSRPVARLRGLGALDHGDRHADPGAVRHGRAAHAVRHLPAGRRRGRGVRADPAADARPLDAERRPQRADTDRIRRARGGRGAARGPLGRVGPMPLFEKTLESSSQLAVRWIVVLVFALALLASEPRPRPACSVVSRPA